MKRNLLLFFVVFYNLLNTDAQTFDSVSLASNKSISRQTIGFHLGTSPFVYGSMVGMDYRYKRANFELNYYGYNVFYFITSLNPYLYMGNSFSKVSISSDFLFRSKRKPKKSFSCGITLIHLWDDFGDTRSKKNELYGINGYNFYPSVGFYNEKLGQSIFNIILVRLK